MVHFTKFRPFHQYQSYYPYYLPSWYSRFYPNHNDRYFQPTDYWLEKRQHDRYLEPTDYLFEKRQPIVTVTDRAQQSTAELDQINNMFRIVILFAALYVLFTLLRR